MMTGKTEPEALAKVMRADGWQRVELDCVAYDDKGQPEYQVNATNPHTGKRVYIANSGVYREHYGIPAAV